MITLKSISLLLCPVIFFIACNKELTYDVTNTNTGDSALIDTTHFIDITLDGQRITGLQQLQADNSYGPWYSLWGKGFEDTNLYNLNFAGVTFKENVGNLIFDFSKGSIYFHESTSDNNPAPASYKAVNAFFAPAIYGYARKSNDTVYTLPSDLNKVFTKTLLTDGIYLSWTDSNGTLWQTCAGSAGQTGSSFTITNAEIAGDPVTDIATDVTVAAAFNCKLYDGAGNAKQLTNGRLKLTILL